MKGVRVGYTGQFLAIILGYLLFSFILVSLNIVPDMWEASSIGVYFLSGSIFLVFLMIYHTVVNKEQDVYRLVQSILYITFGIVMSMGWMYLLNIYFHSTEYIHSVANEHYDYYDHFKSNLLFGKFALVLALIWYNFRHYRFIVTLKHIIETVILVCVFLIYLLDYSVGGLHSKLILNVLDLTMTYYLFIYLFLSHRKGLLIDSVENKYFVIFIAVGILICFIDIFVSVRPLTGNITAIGYFIICLFYTFLFRMILDSVKNFRGQVCRVNDGMTRRAYATVKDLCSVLLDIALILFVLNVLEFSTLELTIFIIGLVAIVGRQVLMLLQRDDAEYSLEDNVIFTKYSNKNRLFQLGIDSSDLLFSSRGRGVIILDKKRRRLAYNKKMERLFATTSDIGEQLKPLDNQVLQEKINEAYKGERQEISLRKPISKSEQVVFDISMDPIVVDEDVCGIKFVVTDYHSKYNQKTSLHSLAFIGETVFKENRNVFMRRVQESLDDGNGGVLVSIQLPNVINWLQFLPHHIIQNLKFEFLDSIERNIPKDSLLYNEGEGSYILYMTINRNEVLGICQKICEDNVWMKKIEDYTVLSSVFQGINFYEDAIDSVDHWIHRTHLLREVAKRERVAYLIYEGKYKELIEMKHFIQSNLRQGIDHKEFYIEYQPKVDSITNEVTALEALVRWNHPKKGIITSGEFIPIAEESNDIILLGTYIFKEVIRQQIEWKEQGIPIVSVAVNVSIKQFQDEEFMELLLNLSRNYPLDISDIVIELTERDNLAENEWLMSVLRRLRILGYEIQIDDFGAGKTVLATIVELPISTIKLDRSIVSRIEEPDYHEIVSAIKKIADQLCIHLICEGVETKEEVEILQLLGCTNVQGFYYYKPLPANEIGKVLLNSRS